MDHTHESEKHLNRQVITSNLKRKLEVCQDDRMKRPAKLIRSEIKQSANEENLNLIDVSRIKRNIYNAKRSYIPALPKNQHGVHTEVTNNTFLTNRKEHFVLANDEDNHIIVFGCQSN